VSAPYDDIKTAPDTVELTTLEEFDVWMAAPHGCIVIKDSVRGAPTIHHKQCTQFTREHFKEKVVENSEGNGRYWWAKNRQVAAARLEARQCRHPGDPFARG
jgi:hypothetical protein